MEVRRRKIYTYPKPRADLSIIAHDGVMSLEKYNSVILEWLIQSNAHEEEALRFWRELGSPSGVDSAALEEMLAIKQCIHTAQFSRALELLVAFVEVPNEVGRARGIRVSAVVDAKFRLALARLIQMIGPSGVGGDAASSGPPVLEPLEVIAFARERVSPLIAQIDSAEQRAEYTRLLSSFVSLLVLPNNAVVPQLERFQSFAELEAWVLEAVNCVQENREATARLSKIVNCYRLLSNGRNK